MEMLLIAVGLVLVLAMLVGVIALVAAKRPAPPPRPGPSPWADPDEAASKRIVLDVEGVQDPDAPSVQRLVQEAATRAFDASPELQVVEVVARDGAPLGEIRRIPPMRRAVEIPEELHEPHQPHSYVPDAGRWQRPDAGSQPGAVPSAGATAARLREDDRRLVEEIDTPGARRFADQYDLPQVVRQRLDDADDPTAVIAALLSAAGRPVERRGDLVLSGEVAVVVALVDDGGESSLSRAFLKVRASGAPYGLIIRLGYADPVVVHKREIAAPHVRHVPARAVQRMADAVALGQDPIAFALGPPVAHR